MIGSISILAYGEEHLKEFFNLQPKLTNCRVYVYTDSPNLKNQENLTVIRSDEDFNFNLKRKCLEAAFQENEIVIMMDTDLSLENEINVDNFIDIPDGLYVNWLGCVQNYKNEKTSINQILTGKSKIAELNNYGIALSECGATINNLNFFDEYLFLLKITDRKTRDDFFNNWEYIDNKTRNSQPKDRHKNELSGALESLIISLSCSKSGIQIYDKSVSVKKIFDLIHHLGSVDITKKLI